MNANTRVADIRDALEETGKATIRGFGTFKVTSRAARTGRNPKTGEPVDIPAQDTITFKASDALKAHFNKQAP